MEYHVTVLPKYLMVTPKEPYLLYFIYLLLLLSSTSLCLFLLSSLFHIEYFATWPKD
jgi:hypothetical protein